MGFQIHFANQRNDIYNFPPIRVRFFLFFKKPYRNPIQNACRYYGGRLPIQSKPI